MCEQQACERQQYSRRRRFSRRSARVLPAGKANARLAPGCLNIYPALGFLVLISECLQRVCISRSLLMKARCLERSLGLSLPSLMVDSARGDSAGVEDFSQRLKRDSRGFGPLGVSAYERHHVVENQY